jgi:putative hydrolase of the HAD superfamily
MNPKKKYTHIFFDLDNTLWDFKTNSRNAMFEAYQTLEINGSADFDLFFDVYTRHNHKLWELYRKKEVGKKELTRLRFQNTFDELRLEGFDADKMNELYLAVMPKQKVLFEGVTETLDYLKVRRYQLNIITNGFREVQYNKIESSGLKPYFNKIFISEEIKSHKPERHIFNYAVKSVNAKKANSLMVGDDYEVDILGAIEYGIDAIFFHAKSGKNDYDLNTYGINKGNLIKIDKIGNLRSIL